MISQSLSFFYSKKSGVFLNVHSVALKVHVDATDYYFSFHV